MNSRRLPAEWENQSGIMLTWPHQGTGWGNSLDDVDPVFAAIASHTSRYERVLIVARNNHHQSHIVSCLEPEITNTENISFAIADSDDSWARDHGPITVVDDIGNPLLLDFQFNGWGNKYPSTLDNKITALLAQQQCFSAPVTSIDIVLEGGSIESDGQGTLLTTRCLLESNRNPGWNKTEIEAELKNQFNVKQVLWLYEGNIMGDDTDAHIDTLARLISPNQIMYVRCEDKDDPHYLSLLRMEQELRALRRLDRQSYELIPLPLPEPVINASNDRLPATYANFLIINNAVLLPVYKQPRDNQVIKIFQEHFPDREIIAIDCLPLIEQFGSLHCVTMQFPAGVLTE